MFAPDENLADRADDSFFSVVLRNIVFVGVLVFIITKTKQGHCFRNYEN